MSSDVLGSDGNGLELNSAHVGAHDSADLEVRAWELIDVGRYMPRRIRGSFRGRELG
jgi:hypothetical protein